MGYVAFSVVFGEQPSAAKWNILGTNDSSFNDGTGIGAGAILPNHLKALASTLNTHAWDSWTPTLSGQFTNGDWTKSCKYMRLGNLCFFRLQLTAADATPMAGGAGSGTFTLPVTSLALVGTATTEVIGTGKLFDSGTASYFCSLVLASTTTANIQAWGAAAANITPSNDITNAVPFTWTTNDEIYAQGFYETAA